MKKTLTILLLIAMLSAVVCVFAACEDDEVVFEKYSEIENDIYKVGDSFKETDAEILAEYSDGTTKTIANNLVFDGKDALKLDDDGKFTDESVGTHKITVYALEKRDDMKIGEWTIIVNK